MTDGQENTSRRFNQAQVKELIRQREAKDWMFSFLGADLNTFAVGVSLGLQASNTMVYNTQNMGGTMAAVASATTRYRKARAAGASNADILREGLYNSEERNKAK
jgi:hypothetical protein